MNEKQKRELIGIVVSDKADKTITKYKTNIRAFIEFSKDKELNKETVIEFKNKLDTIDEYMPNTTNNYLVVLNKFFKFIRRKDLCVNILKQQKKFSVNTTNFVFQTI